MHTEIAIYINRKTNPNDFLRSLFVKISEPISANGKLDIKKKKK